MDNTQELADIISDKRYPLKPETYVSSIDIADAIVNAGYCKIEDRILVTTRMRDAALLAFFDGIHSVQELNDDPALERSKQRMVNAIYAALQAWKAAKFQTSKDHAQRT